MSELDSFSSFDTEGVDVDSLTSGGSVAAPGRYHFEVTDIKVEDGQPYEDESSGVQRYKKTPAIVFYMTVLPAEYGTEAEKAQRGKIHFHRVYVRKLTRGEDGSDTPDELGPPSEGALKSILRFALGLGIISDTDIGRSDTKIPWSRAENAQCCGELKKEKLTNKQKERGLKERLQINYGEVYQPDDERVADWPKDEEALALYLSERDSGGGVPEDELGV